MGKPVAVTGDLTGHGGALLPAPGVTVMAGGKPIATNASLTTCPAFSGPLPHASSGPQPPVTTCVTVKVNGMPPARLGDNVACTGGGSPVAGPGCPTVMIGD